MLDLLHTLLLVWLLDRTVIHRKRYKIGVEWKNGYEGWRLSVFPRYCDAGDSEWLPVHGENGYYLYIELEHVKLYKKLYITLFGTRARGFRYWPTRYKNPFSDD